MRHPKAMAWEAKLKAVFDEIDDRLEARHGDRYPRHPVRPPHGVTANREHDGLFNVGASFSAGFGSDLGPGYVVELQVRTLASIPAEERQRLEDETAGLLRELLPRAFPDRKLKVDRDGRAYKIYGDLKLGKV